MSQYPTDGTYLTLTTAASATATSGFHVPRGVKGITIIAPNLTTDTTYNLQILDPATADGGSETWSTLNVYDLIDGSNKAITDVPDSVAAFIWPIPSGAVFRITFATAQAATFRVLFHY